MNADLVPRSEAVNSLAQLDQEVLLRALTGGDDYEILFSVSYKQADAFESACTLDVHHIGEIIEGKGVSVSTTDGETVEFPSTSWSHFD